MQTILLALLPIFTLISLGYFFKRINFPSPEFWPYADKFTYYVLFPSLLVYKLANANINMANATSFVGSAVITVMLLSIILIIINKFAFFFKDDAFTSVYQGTVRFNTYVFLALTSALYGDEGLVLAALLMAFMIPFLNIACITIFAIYVPNEKISIFSLLKSIFTNPLIVACFIGGSLNYFDIVLFDALNKTFEVLSSAALPLGLLSVGVGLQLSFLKEVKLELFSSLFFKLGLFPALIFSVGNAFGIVGLELAILVLFASMPTASSAYILARQLGGDLKLMAAIITAQTLLSIITITLFLWVFI